MRQRFEERSQDPLGIEMHFDWTISLGTVVTIVVILGGFYRAHTQNLKRLDRIEYRVALMYTWFLRTVLKLPPEEKNED